MKASLTYLLIMFLVGITVLLNIGCQVKGDSGSLKSSKLKILSTSRPSSHTDSIQSLILCPSLPSDLDGDGTIDFKDLAILQNDFGTSEVCSDLNSDSIVNVIDLNIFRSDYCASDNIDINLDGQIDQTDLDILRLDFGTADACSDLNSDNIVNVLDLNLLRNGYCASNNPDLNMDGVIDAKDLDILKTGFGTNSICIDLNSDNIVNVLDLNIFRDSYCTPSNPDLNMDGIVDSHDSGVLQGNIGTSDRCSDLNQDGQVDSHDLAALESVLAATP